MRTIVSRQFTVDKSYVEIFGTSSESKPTVGIVTGSRYTEVNTGDVYLFNETASEWVKQPAAGGSSGFLTVTSDNGTLDRTWQEIYDAAENGIPTALRTVEEDNILFNWLSAVFKESGDEDTFYVDFGTEGMNFEEFTSDTATGYPSSQS